MRSGRYSLRLGLALLVLAVLATTLTAGSRSRGEFMFLDQLQPGMQGICKTAVSGDGISTFNFELIDVITLPKDSSMILTRMWGEAISRSGGIASGMSGSPCYINDKLIGALFAVYVEDGFHDIASIEERPHALVQPIEYMLAVLDTCQAGAGAGAGTSAARGVDVLGGSASFTAFTGEIRPLAGPVMVGGLSARTFAWMANGVDPNFLDGDRALFRLRGERAFEGFARALTAGVEQRYGLKLYPMAGSSAGTSDDPADLEPGSPIGAALMLGDVRSGSYGTVTYIENDCLVAYGHPFLSLGATEIPMNAVSILDTIKNVKSPFKLGALGEEIGAIVEDRSPAIGGALGAQARTIQFNVGVADKDSGRSESFGVRSVALPDWHWNNLWIVGAEAIDSTIGRIGQGTVVLDMTIKGAGISQPLRRHDIFVSNSDISAEAMLEPSWIDYLLAWNEFADPQISEINLDLSVEKALRVKVVEAVEIEDLQGTRLSYKVTLQPHRGMLSEVIKGSLDVGRGKGDYVYLHVFPAREAFWKFEMLAPWERPYYVDRILNLTELIGAIEGAPTNDLILVAARSANSGTFYDFEVKSVGDWYADGERQSEYMVEVEQ